MSKSLVVAVALGALMIGSCATARKTYTLTELEAMKKAGVLNGDEKYMMLGHKGLSDKDFVSDGTPVAPVVASESVTSSIEIAGNDTVMVTNATFKSAPVQPASADTQPIAYDRIGKTRYLITMAREYYGNGDFWPYIYEENKAKFGHPDKIKPGTTVLVPSLSKYGVSPKNPADVEKAKKMGKEIYARYGKMI